MNHVHRMLICAFTDGYCSNNSYFIIDIKCFVKILRESKLYVRIISELRKFPSVSHEGSVKLF